MRLQVDVDCRDVDLQSALEEGLLGEEIERHRNEVTADLVELLLDVLHGHVDASNVTGLDGRLRDPFRVLLPSLDMSGGNDVENLIKNGGVLVGGALPKAFSVFAEWILIQRSQSVRFLGAPQSCSSLTITSLSSSEAVSSM